MNPVSVNAGNAVEAARTIRDGCVVGPSTVRRSATCAKIAAALCGAQSEIQNPTKNKQNPHLKNWYADITAVLGAVLPVFTKHKLAVTQLPCELDGEPALLTLVLHDSGEWLETVTKIRPVKTDPQSIGSAQSYARRYALQSVAGVAADDDDDGNAGSRPAAGNHAPQHHAQPRSVADRCLDAIAKAANRDALTAIYRQYEADRENGVFTKDDEAGLDAAFKAAGKKFPAAPAKA